MSEMTSVVLTCVLVLTSQCLADSFLVLHPFYAGSHVLTLHSVAENLIVRYEA
jgi:hypothetical protein